MLQVAGNKQLDYSLEGLKNLEQGALFLSDTRRSLASRSFDNPLLESLDPLVVPRIAASIDIASNPRLEGLGAFAAVTDTSHLQLWEAPSVSSGAFPSSSKSTSSVTPSWRA